MPIELRYNTFFAYLDVPADLRLKLNRRVFRQTLKTDSRSVAERRAAPLIAQWKSEISRLREEPNHNDAKYWREALRRAPNDEQRNAILERIDMMAWNIGALNVEHVGDTPSKSPEARKFYAEATGLRVGTTEHLEEWIGSQDVKEKTAKMRRSTIHRLGEKFSTLQDISRKEVRRWVTELGTDLHPATVQRLLSDCRTYWSYLAAIEVVSEDAAPFDRLGLKVKSASWLPYSPAEALRLRKAADGDNNLADLVSIAMYSGARREEICSLKVEHVRSGCFEIVDAKTEAGIRTVPIHSKLSAIIKRLTKESADGYLIPGLASNGNGDRGDAIGKRFSRLKRSLGFTERHSFHSWRSTVITILERAGVPEGTVQDIVGHERSTLTGSTYSGKTTIEMRRDALRKLRY